MKDGESDPTMWRLWPAWILGLVLVLTRFVVPPLFPGFEGFRIAVLGGLLSSACIFLWWSLFSRAHTRLRWGAPGAFVALVTLTWAVNHPSMGLMWLVYYALPLGALTLVAWAVWGRRLAPRGHGLIGLAMITLVIGVWTMVRMHGFTGDHVFELAWRWNSTAEDSLPSVPQPEGVSSRTDRARPSAVVESSWPGFRGAGRDAVVRGTAISTDWIASPPIELWRRAVGPAWSSFAVAGDLIYTLEQRGDLELVSCYELETGAVRWSHAQEARFYEAMGGVGPRSTPTVADGRVYAVGATGRLVALSMTSGEQLWSRDLREDAEIGLPIWGFAASPLVVNGLLVVAAGGRLLGFDALSGELQWRAPPAGPSYSSPQWMTLEARAQIVQLTHEGVVSVDPTDGSLLWSHGWPGTPLVQPAALASDGVLISAGEGKGVRRLAVRRSGGGWSVSQRWTSNRLKPNFNDLVVHGVHAYGFDGRILAALDLATGKRLWKGGRHGHGQLLLLVDQSLLLVVGERGQLALVRARPERYEELASVDVLSAKTWNHPVLVGDVLLIRNGEEMAAFRLPPED